MARRAADPRDSAEARRATVPARSTTLRDGPRSRAGAAFRASLPFAAVTSPTPQSERRRAARALASFPVKLSSQPDAEPAVLRDATLPVRTWRFTYDDGAHDARTLLAAPRGARLWVVTKALGGAGLYALPALPAVPSGGTSSEVLVATKTAPVDGVITDGSVSPDGRHTVLRGYLKARLYRSVPPGRTSQPVPLPTQLQGEAIAWSSDGRVLFTAGGHEGTLWRVPVPGITPVPAPTRSPSPSASAAPAPAPSGGSSSATVRRVLLGTGLALGAGALAFVASRRYRVG